MLEDYKPKGPYKQEMESITQNERQIKIQKAGMRYGRRRTLWIGGTLLAGAAFVPACNTFIDSGGATATGKAAGVGGSEAINVVGGAATGAKELSTGVVGGITEESDINLDNPFTRDGDVPVSNTTPVKPENGPSNESPTQGEDAAFDALKESVVITEVPLGEDGERNYSAAGVIATPIQVAKACFDDGSMEMSSTEWADVYSATVLTLQNNFESNGAFFEEQSPTLNPGDVVYCR